jgi:hypothetical protein
MSRAKENIEDIVAAQTRKHRVETAILGTLAVGGVVAIGAMGPGALHLLKYAMPHLNERYQKQTIGRAVGRLIKQGYIQKEGERYRITDKGRQQLDQAIRTAQLNLAHRARTGKWDKKWRIVIFDIKEKRRAVRDELRSLLITTGFVKLQDSVWVYPHRCDEVIALLKFHLTLGRDLVYIIADGIEGDEALRKHFGLPAEER